MANSEYMNFILKKWGNVLVTMMRFAAKVRISFVIIFFFNPIIQLEYSPDSDYPDQKFHNSKWTCQVRAKALIRQCITPSTNGCNIRPWELSDMLLFHSSQNLKLSSNYKQIKAPFKILYRAESKSLYGLRRLSNTIRLDRV